MSPAADLLDSHRGRRRLSRRQHDSSSRRRRGGRMSGSEESPTIDEHTDLWLTPGELASWLSVVRLITRLPWAIDTQLQRDAGLSMVEYMTMAMLGNAPERTMRM